MDTVRVEGEYVILEAPLHGNEGRLTNPAIRGIVVVGDKIQKRFRRSRMRITPQEIEAEIAKFRGETTFGVADTLNQHQVVFGMSGYSTLDSARCNKLGIRLGDYENAVVGIVRNCIEQLRAEIKGSIVKIAYGAADMGVDAAIEAAAREKDVEILGFSCPSYLWYVETESNIVVCVAADEAAYCDYYIQTLDVLFAANGGTVSYRMDTRAAITFAKRVIVIDVLEALGSSVPGFDGNGQVIDAAAALRERLAIINYTNSRAHGPDRYRELVHLTVRYAIRFARQVLAPAIAFNLTDSDL